MRCVVVLLLAVVACGGGGGGAGVEAKLAEDVSAQLGAPVTVTCPAGPFPKPCAVHVEDGDDLTIDVTDTKDAWQWSLRGFVIATAPLVAAIREELDDLGVQAEIACGPALRAAAVGERVRCDLDLGGVAGAAWATILDEDASFELELALSPEAVEARTSDVDDVALTRASRELDRDEAEGEDDDAPRDAGPALDSAR